MKITEIYGFIMINLVASFLSTGTEANPQCRETCDDFSDVNGYCKINSDCTGRSIHCLPGYVLPLGSDKCVLKANHRGPYTCVGYTYYNAICEVNDNGWSKSVRCVDGYTRVPNTQHCARRSPDNAYSG